MVKIRRADFVSSVMLKSQGGDLFGAIFVNNCDVKWKCVVF